MDEETAETTNAAFWTVVEAVDAAERHDQPLSADVSRMLHHIFDADMHLLQHREKLTTNVSCMQPDESQGVAGAARRMNYIFDDAAHAQIPLAGGRRCEGGTCCDKCSRNIFPTFATFLPFLRTWRLFLQPQSSSSSDLLNECVGQLLMSMVCPSRPFYICKHTHASMWRGRHRRVVAVVRATLSRCTLMSRPTRGTTTRACCT